MRPLASLVFALTSLLWAAGCGSSDDSTASTGGTAGNAGAAGNAGQSAAGSAGKAGQSGAAGKAGQGGTGGAAGKGGAAGQGGSGAAGTGGQTAGTGGKGGSGGSGSIKVTCGAFVEPAEAPGDTGSATGKLAAALCTFSDSLASSFAVDTIAATEEGGQIYLYIPIDATRRYRLVSQSPCVFERDLTVEAAGKLPQGTLGADDKGRVFGAWSEASGAGRVGQLYPPVTSCPVDPFNSPENLAVNAGGDQLVATVHSLKSPTNFQIGETLAPSTCALAGLGLCADYVIPPLIAIDHKGRVHATTQRQDGPDNTVIAYDTTGKPLFTYGAAALFGANSLARCKSGICIADGSDEVFAFSDDGAFVDRIQIDQSALPDPSFPVIAAVPSGPLFYLTNTTTNTGADYTAAVYLVTGL
jgi:hypothetical protein